MFNGMNGLEILKNWPRYESGETLPIGGEFMGKDGKTYTANQIQFIGKCFSLYDFCDRKPQFNGFYGERVKRPQVLAADGEPLEVGQTVYATHYGYVKCTVLAIEWVVDGYLVEVENESGCKFRQIPDEFIHQRPVLDADGEPLEVGQTVWHVGNGVEFTVIGLPNPGEYQAVKLRLDDGAFTGLDPDRLTHQRPVLDADGVPIKVGDTVWDIETGCGRTVRAVNDNGTVEFDGHENRGWFGKFLTHAKPDLDTWERIEEDKGLNPFDYCKKVGHKLFTFDNAEEYKSSDLVRRCRALAERERGE